MGKFRFGKAAARTAVALLALMLLGCEQDNGLPKALVAHLKSRGIAIEPTRTSGPFTKRRGYVVAKYDERTAGQIIGTFEMRRVLSDNRSWLKASHDLDGIEPAEQLWGFAGAPSSLKPAQGDRFEHLYMLVSPKGDMFLVAEYAPG